MVVAEAEWAEAAAWVEAEWVEGAAEWAAAGWAAAGWAISWDFIGRPTALRIALNQPVAMRKTPSWRNVGDSGAQGLRDAACRSGR
jgi:hypothetical protein